MIRPWISEKSMLAVDKGIYTFQMDIRVSRQYIAQYIKKYFKVDPIRVNTICRKGKNINFKRVKGKRKNIIFALVKIKKGQKIPGFEIEQAPTEEKKLSKDSK